MRDLSYSTTPSKTKGVITPVDDEAYGIPPNLLTINVVLATYISFVYYRLCKVLKKFKFSTNLRKVFSLTHKLW